MNSYSRKFEALDITGFCDLTAKQCLVYSFLMSKSVWNAQDKEGHYYVYKNSYQVKTAADFLKISENTFRTAIRELRRQDYIWYECEKEDENIPYKERKMKERKGTKYYIINFPKTYTPLDIELIKVLLSYGASIGGGRGGTIVSVYAMICRYYNYCQSKPVDNHCYLNIGQIRNVFHKKRKTEIGDNYRLMIAIFEFLELVEVKKEKLFYNGGDYMRYEFINPKLKLDPKFYLTDDGPDDISDILNALENEIGAEEK